MKISQSFFSVQAEGISSGVPSYFVRLSGCNLSCGMSPKNISALKKYLNDNPDVSGNSDLDREYGDLLQEGKATWVCDSISVWLNGKNTTNEELEQRMNEAGVFDRILKGEVHIIWTGGEPTMSHHVRSIAAFLDYISKKYPDSTPFSEIETNGSLVVNENGFYGTARTYCNEYINQINCSAKLSNSGMAEYKRINPDAIKQIKRHPNYWFKFVISEEKDIKEIQETYLIPFGIPDDRVIIMPGVDNLEDLSERTRFLFEMSKKYGYRGVTRSQILSWNKTTGV